MLVDGMALLFRGFFATSYSGNYMRTSTGMPTNGIYAFLKYFLNAIETFQPTHVICCWDMGSRTFRSELYKPYKANRAEPPEELIPQFDLVKDVVESFGVPNVGLEGYEADDCIGTLSESYRTNHDVLILTGDQDILQLVDERVEVAIMKKGQGNYKVYNTQNFHEEKNLSPTQIVDLKGLMGDTSDNYPGVKGVGEKTALKLLHQYHTVENMLAHLDELPNGVRKKVSEHLEMLHLSRKLAKIYCDVPVNCSLEAAKWDMDIEKVSHKLQELDMNSMVKSIQKIKSVV
ncbi:5'-3' exonuclease [Salirhabdus salicampi]|uniref:5'-3' exonuclease n=1 Tax=Salirhabdus salicampi TaxID=476102 RepID=UPI0020C576DD|nr:5'-3' exonuclease H3TH domain-containing protein [Salirhabdus salicampi]MCP8616166.1 5'-3' exonuclease [Salirhabdus salicampi]